MSVSSLFAKAQVVKLVSEYHVNPIGIDVQKPRLSWQIISDGQNVMQTAYEIKVTDQTAKGKLIWTSGKVESDQSVNVVYGGPALKSMQRACWQVRIWDNNKKVSVWSQPAYWEMGILEPESWKASWIGSEVGQNVEGSKPCLYFRKEFPVAKKIKSARIYATSKGLYQLFLNGKKVSSDLFTPGWTSYSKRLQYQTYDVTGMLQQKNLIGAIVGDGWYRGNIAFKGQHSYYGDKLALLTQLQITYSDGTSEIIGTDESWKAANGPIIMSDIYNGETYDARKEMPGWANIGFNDSNWTKASVIDQPKNTLIAPQGVPVKAVTEIKPVKLITTPKGETVLDMGQNMVGWVRLKVQGKKGDQVTIKFAEVLDKEGNFYTDNLRAAKCTDVYILKGEGEEIYEPHFTFHGFRFVKIEGFPGTPALDNITGVVIHSDMPQTGSFACSEPLINQLQHNIQWGQRGNFLDVPTDCPQRDERLGWTGDAQVFSMTAAFNFDVAAFYTKWMKDVAADQLPDGKVPHVIPDVLKGAGGSTAWADASIIVPWTVYRIYGDKRILEEQYASMKAWVEYMKNRAGEDNLWTGDIHYGDWLAFASTRSDYTGATTEKDLIATAYYCYSSKLLSKIAGIIGNKADADKYDALAKNIKKAFIAEFVTPNGRLVSHTQTAYALALSFDLLPENIKEKAATYFADDVKKFKHLTTGFVGAPLVCSTLSAIGCDDLAFMLLTRKEYPSWLYPVTQGATTIWERWDGQKPDGTFQNVGMNSFNHYAYGAIGEWMYGHVAGMNIDPEKPAYKHILFNPHTGGGLTNASAEFSSMYGLVKSAWKFDGEDFVYEIAVPVNATATVTLPQAKTTQLTVNSLPLNEEMKNGMQESTDAVVLKLGSGNYQFRYPAAGLKTKTK
ncbi:MAG: alpha-L-rhamnosidase [Bacteroidetes bacterium GWF2_42_66]|nr:MAG: alpha-L-rhamnosidase [Bacteroidetes bacterium GWA2_42_15]OFX97264.1 MAG: alpha-L-rhamnosidase [Bacteroidetes bacterium GWE2_42_39]OFY39901.1 MAG: alpha-L-rhamnosidase [Bacteroidetes bacterium GWF2_42_66]HBL78080.1 alpha-L-rhamnosidase [Prolixibacteraceae bacterium]HCR91975.1 alpha-L-rhamnosidase [Prolixibacteraceae bacterium]